MTFLRYGTRMDYKHVSECDRKTSKLQKWKRLIEKSVSR